MQLYVMLIIFFIGKIIGKIKVALASPVLPLNRY